MSVFGLVAVSSFWYYFLILPPFVELRYGFKDGDGHSVLCLAGLLSIAFYILSPCKTRTNTSLPCLIRSLRPSVPKRNRDLHIQAWYLQAVIIIQCLYFARQPPAPDAPKHWRISTWCETPTVLSTDDCRVRRIVAEDIRKPSTKMSNVVYVTAFTVLNSRLQQCSFSVCQLFNTGFLRYLADMANALSDVPLCDYCFYRCLYTLINMNHREEKSSKCVIYVYTLARDWFEFHTLNVMRSCYRIKCPFIGQSLK